MYMLKVVGALILFLAGCPSLPLPAASNTSKCGDQCATFTCPQGSHCTLGGNCAPSCEGETLAPR
jgi:hypothetical protein